MPRRSLTLLIAFCALSLRAADVLDTDERRISYAIGRQLGENLKSQGIALDMVVFSASAGDALAGRPSLMTPEEQQQALQVLQKKVEAFQRAPGEAFLSANKKKKGVKTTASGLQYKVLKAGAGSPPKPTDKVRVHYRGTFIDGQEFDSSHKRNQPAEFPLKQVISGWTEGLQLMKPGAKYTFYVPSDMAYGAQGRTGIPPHSTLIFDVELLEVLKEDQSGSSSR